MKDENTAINREIAAANTTPERDAKSGRFLPGNKPRNPGRGVSGRTKALRTLDLLLASSENQRKLQEAMQAAFDHNPMKFFRTIVMPLLPKEARMEMETAGTVLWTRISEAFPPVQE